MKKIWKIGILGCGNIANIYVENIQKYFNNMVIVACTSLHSASATQLALKYHIPCVCTFQTMLVNPEIDAILNLTPPHVHYELNQKILSSGKHLYSEKPLAATCEEIKNLMLIADKMKVRIGCAPDTWLGPAIQTCSKIIRREEIGRVISVTANLMNHGVESWHPSPMAYYQPCGGPVLDMGPYYITALVAMLGPIEDVTTYRVKGSNEREIYSSPLQGTKIPVQIDTTYCSILKFCSGSIGTLHMSFDTWSSTLPMLEIYGTEGTLLVPDPNWFDGEIKLIRSKNILDQMNNKNNSQKIEIINTLQEWYSKEFIPKDYFTPTKNLRGLGFWDMLYCIESGSSHHCNTTLLLHITEVLQKINTQNSSSDPISKYTCTCPTSIVERITLEEGRRLCLQNI